MSSDDRSPTTVSRPTGGGLSRFDLAKLASDLEPTAEGYWLSKKTGAVFYPEEGNENCFAVEETSFWFRHRNRCITSLVRRLPPAAGVAEGGDGAGPILEVGAGNGAVAAALAAAGHTVIALEPGAVGARNAVSRGLPAVIRARFEDVSFRDGALGGIGLFDVLEHVDDDLGFLLRARSILSPGGRLYLTVPAGPWLWSVDDEYAGHHRRYTLGTLRRVLANAGFHLEFASGFFAFLTAPIFVCRRLPSLAGLRAVEDAARVNEHESLGRPAAALVDSLLAAEWRWLDRGKALPFGSSLIAAATAR